MEDCDTYTDWVSADTTNFTVTAETTDIIEGTGAVKVAAKTILGVCDSYSESNYGTLASLYTGDYTACGQSFTGDGKPLHSAVFYLRKNGLPTGNAVVKIYAHTGTFGDSSKPTGAALATSDVFDVATLTTSLALITFNFTGANRITLADGTYYVVVIEYSGGDSSNRVYVAKDDSSQTHEGNGCNSTDSLSWSSTSSDRVFYVYTGDGVLANYHIDRDLGAGGVVDLTGISALKLWIKSTALGDFIFSMGEAAATEQTKSFSITSVNTWTNITWDISAIATGDKDAIRYLRLTQDGDNAASYTLLLDKIYSDTVLTFNGMGQRNNEYPHALYGTTWMRWSGSAWTNVQTSLASAKAKFLEFNTEAARYTICVDGTNRYSWNGSAAASITAAPATNLYAVDDYRLYALLDSVLKCSAEGSITDWTTANDADSIAITSMVGPGTAIAAYNDLVICWSEQTMHVLYGNDPYDFYLSDPIENGCISDRSVQVHNGVLYFLDYGKFMRYVGGKPQEISQKVRTYLEAINTTYKTDCVSGKHGKYIYLSIPYGSTATENNLTLEYDTELDTWYVIPEGYNYFINIGEYLYGVDSDGVFYKMNSGTDNNGIPMAWAHITGVMNKGTVSQKKNVSDYWVVADLPSTSKLSLYYSSTVDGDDFRLLHTFYGSANEQNTRIQVPTTEMQNLDWYRLKFAGTGPCTIHYVQEDLRIKAR